MQEYRFRIHYSKEEAELLLPQLRVWLDELDETRTLLAASDCRLGQLLAVGQDLGGELVSNWLKHLARELRLLSEFRRRDIQLKDLDRGLVDFPAIIGGREVFLCWEKDEDEIEHWHALESGFAGRERL